jgi:septum site-determining protein MinC
LKKAKPSAGKKLYLKKDTLVTEDNTESLQSEEQVSVPIAEPVSETAEPEKVRLFDSKDAWQQAPVDENTILIKRTIRSGQSIQFEGNVVVMGDINPGSEIIASGNVVVMGALRGVVHAGATGNEAATVSAFKLQPTQLRIANHITRAPDGDYQTPEGPETARIKDGVVVIEVYHMGQDRQTKIG